MTEGSKPYEMLNHTADMGLRVRGGTLETLFENAALAVFENLAELKDVAEETLQEVRVKGMDREELMVNWINELLFLWETKLILFKNFSVMKMDTTSLQGRVRGGRYDKDRHELLTEIKAATYHHLRIEEKKGFWQAEIILDT